MRKRIVTLALLAGLLIGCAHVPAQTARELPPRPKCRMDELQPAKFIQAGEYSCLDAENAGTLVHDVRILAECISAWEVWASEVERAGNPTK